jgi:hypothetical protein
VLRDIGLLSYCVNAIIEFVDPPHFQELQEVQKELKKKVASFEALVLEDPLLYEGRGFLFDQMSGVHTNSQNPHLGWAILVGLGEHTNTYLKIPNLGLLVCLNPRDAIVLHGCVIPHETLGWDGGQWICVPHFTHSTLWRALGRDSVFLA